GRCELLQLLRLVPGQRGALRRPREALHGGIHVRVLMTSGVVASSTGGGHSVDEGSHSVVRDGASSMCSFGGTREEHPCRSAAALPGRRRPPKEHIDDAPSLLLPRGALSPRGPALSFVTGSLLLPVARSRASVSASMAIVDRCDAVVSCCRGVREALC